MSISLKQAADLTSIAIEGFSLIAKVTSNTTDDRIAEAFDVIRKIVHQVGLSEKGKISPEACSLALAQLHEGMQSNVDAFEEAKRRKFNPDDDATDD